jgi:gliding motility-associated-like protein
MRNVTLACVGLFIGTLAANAQQFEKRFITKLDENLAGLQAEWVSMDNDTLLDVVVVGSVNDQLKIVVYKNLNDLFLGKVNTLPTGMKSGYVQLADWNKDNKMDLVIAGKTLINTDATFYFQGNGNLTFSKNAQKLVDHSGQFRIGDFDGDATLDVLTFGPSFIRIYRNSGTTLTKEFDLTNINPTDVSVFDMNNDGMTDFVVTGKNNQDKVVTSVFIGAPKFKYFKKNLATPIDGALSLADADNNGLFDVIVSSKDLSRTWLNNGDTLITNNSFDGTPGPRLFTGDMTSDGNTDILLPGVVRELTGLTTSIDSAGLILQRMGDHDRDGDLDLVQVIDSIGSQWLKYFENTTTANNADPEFPIAGYAISTFDRTFIFWEPANDDHTPTQALTYDVWLGTNQQTIVMPSFDLSGFHRSVVRHGNAGANTSMIIKGLADNRYFYQIQSVDNAYNGSIGSCNGNVLPCFDLAHQEVQACKGFEVKLAGGKDAVWFSLSKGFLESSDTLTFVASVTDTLFAFIPQTTDCSKNKVYVVHVNDGPRLDKEVIYACKDKSVTLKIEEGWEGIVWDSNPPTLNVSSIQYMVTKPDTITVTAKGKGCEYKKQFFIKISEPEVSIAGDGFQVMKGNSVQLEASGTAEQWEWDPALGLNNSTIPNPTATPTTSTEYVLTGTDSVGCTATASTHVFVQETAFVPNLFTPNGDGKNDNLVIYGLTSPGDFKFRIFNREGSLVYETKDVAHATTVGWNGFVQGTQQPNGIYYWRIDGETGDGSKLLLNGKTSGSILLVH